MWAIHLVGEARQKGVVPSVMRGGLLPGEDAGMGDTGPMKLQLEVANGDQEPLTGLVRTPDGRAHEFSGWSELFAVLATLLAPSR